MIIVLITVIVLFNFYLKKNLFLSTLIGLLLILFYFLIKYDTSFLTVLYEGNVYLMLKIMSFILVAYSFKYINDATSFTKSKEALQNLLDLFLKDKKIKILTIVVISFFFFNFPYIGIMYLSMIAIFFRISKMNIVLIPITMLTLFGLFNYLISIDILGITVNYITFIGIIYISYFIFIVVEKLRKRKYFNVISIGINALFSLFLYVLTLNLYLIFQNLYRSSISLVFSLILTLLIANVLTSKYSFIIDKEEKEKSEENAIIILENFLPNVKLPIFILVLFISVSILGCLLVSVNYIIGCMFIAIVNFVFVKILKQNKTKVDYNGVIKLIIVAILVYIDISIIKNNILSFLIRNDSYETFRLIYFSQIFMFLPRIDIQSLTNSYSIVNIIDLKILIIIQLQVYFSFVTIFIVNYVLTLEKEEIIHIVTIILMSSLLIQALVYVY